jgi:hypothetical protein
MSNNRRIERLLRELHASPPLLFLEDMFSLTEFALEEIRLVKEAARRDDHEASMVVQQPT